MTYLTGCRDSCLQCSACFPLDSVSRLQCSVCFPPLDPPDASKPSGSLPGFLPPGSPRIPLPLISLVHPSSPPGSSASAFPSPSAPSLLDLRPQTEPRRRQGSHNHLPPHSTPPMEPTTAADPRFRPEQCYTIHGLELSRVTVVTSSLQVVYDTFVRPDNEVIDYNTRHQ
ncbi:apoptosis-enhancing nuclease-like [Acanthochromis polyacanthus]|uniref:apoptosis-enhancing nuclease-like n=1 Tax=Acanthochromis polyacanthus TaxID=80966 RepID=UPI002233ED38|nr:apoptosis-enhancing nuclease-like [Acanthochromis polyacanthus]